MSQGFGLPSKENCPEPHSAGLPLSQQVLALTELEGGFSSFPWVSCLLSLALTWTTHPAGDTPASLPNHVLPFSTHPSLTHAPGLACLTITSTSTISRHLLCESFCLIQK